MSGLNPNDSVRYFTSGDRKALIDADVGLETGLCCLMRTDLNQKVVVFPFIPTYDRPETEDDFGAAADELCDACPTTIFVGVSPNPFYQHPDNFFEKSATGILFHNAVWLPESERFCFMSKEPVPLDEGLAKLAKWDPERFSNDAPHPRKVFVYIGITPPPNLGVEHIGTDREVAPAEILRGLVRIVTVGHVEESSLEMPDMSADDEGDWDDDAEDEEPEGDAKIVSFTVCT